MRLIDADAYMEKVRHEAKAMPRNEGETFVTLSEWIMEKTPSVKSEQGEWKIEYSGNGWNDYLDYTCPNCGKKYERADAVLYKANFCPNCGARMKGADDEEST